MVVPSYGEARNTAHSVIKQMDEDLWRDPIDQGWANYGSRAKYGALRGSMRLAKGLENAKKN
jgi:hypothetical protein